MGKYYIYKTMRSFFPLVLAHLHLAFCYEHLVAQGAGTALDFDGSDDYLSAGTINHNIGTGDFTWEVWVKTPLTYNNINPIVTNGTYSPAIYTKMYNDTEWGFYYGGYKTAGTVLTTDTWYHLAVVRESGTLKFYQDGIQTPTTHSETSNITNSVFDIGRSGPGYPGRNTIDEIRFWTIARSQAQIRATMHTHLQGNETGLIGYWTFDEGSGSSADDLTGNGHDATLYNMDPATDWITSLAVIGDASNLETGTANLNENAAVPVDIIWDNDPGVNAIFAAVQVNENPDINNNLLNYYPANYWELWIAADDGAYQADVTFHYDDINGIADEANLRLFTRSEAGQNWNEASNYNINTEGSNTDGIGSVTIENITSLDQYILTSSVMDNPLPVTLISFTATEHDSGVDISWITETELNNYMFYLDRSIDGLSFQRISEIPSQGNSIFRKRYTFTDKDVKTGQIYYYRLADYSYNGQVLYHPVISITLEASEFSPERMVLFPNYPNPFNSATTIKYFLQKPSNVTLNIYNIFGQHIKTLVNGKQSSGYHKILFDAKELSSGVYYYKLATDDNTSKTNKLVLIK